VKHTRLNIYIRPLESDINIFISPTSEDNLKFTGTFPILQWNNTVKFLVGTSPPPPSKILLKISGVPPSPFEDEKIHYISTFPANACEDNSFY